MNAILPFLNKFVPIGLAIKGIEKVSPQLGKFVSAAAGAGYSTDSIFEFLKNKIENPAYIDEKSRLEQGSQQGTLRPDEASSHQRIQQREAVPNTLGKGIAGAAGLIGGLSGLSQASNPESNQQPETLGPEEQYDPSAQAGVPKNQGRAPSPMSAAINEQIQSAPPTGRGPSPMSQSINEQMKGAAAQQRSYDPLAALRQFPALAQFIEKEAAAGSDAGSISAKAKQSKLLNPIVSRIESKIGEPFEALLARLVGQPQQAQSQQQSAPQQGSKREIALQLARAYKAAGRK